MNATFRMADLKSDEHIYDKHTQHSQILRIEKVAQDVLKAVARGHSLTKVMGVLH